MISNQETLTVDPSKEGKTETCIGLPHKRILSSLLEELKPVDFHEQAGLNANEPLGKKHFIILTIDEVLAIAKRNKWSLCRANGQIYLYNGSYWNLLTEEELQHFLGQAAKKLGVDKFDAQYHSFQAELLKQFRVQAHLPRPDLHDGKVLVNFQNGTLEIQDGLRNLRNFDRRDFLRYVLPFNYTPGAKAPLFQSFLNQVLPDKEQQKVLAEYIGSIFISNKRLKLEKALILYGTGANGKSTFYEIVRALLGPSNICSYSLQSLTNENGYHRAQLAGHLVNYASEISTRMDSTLFKQLVSGEPVEARSPYQPPFIMESYAKLIFNTNELPRDIEHSPAFFRRFLLIEFGVTIPEKDRNPKLAEEIIATELPGIFNWVMEGMDRLLSQSGFTHSRKIEEAVRQYQTQSDSVHLFLDDAGYKPDLSTYMPLKEMYAQYREYCQDALYKACSLNTYAKRLRLHGFDVSRRNYGTIVYAAKKPIS